MATETGRAHLKHLRHSRCWMNSNPIGISYHTSDVRHTTSLYDRYKPYFYLLVTLNSKVFWSGLSAAVTLAVSVLLNLLLVYWLLFLPK